MKQAEWKRAVVAALDGAEGWGFASGFAYRLPVGRVARGLLVDTSRFNSQSIYIWQITSPLFSPDHVFNGQWSKRSGYSGLSEGELHSTIRALASEPFSEEKSLAEFVELGRDSRDGRSREVAAYSQLLLGDRADAKRLLASVIADPGKYDWSGPLADRALLMLQHLDAGDDLAAIAQLDLWVAETKAQEKLQ